MRAVVRWSLIRWAITTGVLLLIWLLFTSNCRLLNIVAGAVGAAVVAALTYDIFIARHQASLRFFVPHPFYLMLYLAHMVLGLYTSSIRVLAAVVNGRVNSRIVHFRTRLRSDLARMFLANAVSLSPGTVVLDLNDDHITVHWLFCTTTHSRGAREAIAGRIERVLQRVWI